MDVGSSPRLWFGASVVFAVKGQEAFDIAVIQMENFDLNEKDLGPFRISTNFQEGMLSVSALLTYHLQVVEAQCQEFVGKV